MKPSTNKEFPDNEPIPVLHPKTHLFLQTIRKKSVIIGAICVVALLIIIAFFFWRQYTTHTEESGTAALLSQELQEVTPLFEAKKEGEKETSAHDLLEKLVAITEHNPQLQRQFSGVIAQEMIFEHDERFVPWAKHAIKTLDGLKLYPYAAFSTTSMLMSEKKIEQAYVEALKQVNHETHAAAHPALSALTLLQLATAAQQLHMQTEKEVAIDKLKNLLTRLLTEPATTILGETTAEKVFRHFEENGVSILE